MEAMLGISLYSCFYLKLAQMLCLFFIISYGISSTKLEKKAEQFLPGSNGDRGEHGGGGSGPNNVYTYQ
jgi:hypothetical protein